MLYLKNKKLDEKLTKSKVTNESQPPIVTPSILKDQIDDLYESFNKVADTLGLPKIDESTKDVVRPKSIPSVNNEHKRLVKRNVVAVSSVKIIIQKFIAKPFDYNFIIEFS